MVMKSSMFWIAIVLIAQRIDAFSLSSSSTTTRPTTKLAAQNSGSCDVAIFGGGFGGLYTALAISREARLRKRDDLVIKLIDPSDEFVFLPLLYDLTVGTATEAEVCPRYSDLLQGTGIEHVKGSLRSLSGQQAVLTTSTDDVLQFRSAVISVGASPESILQAVPGASEFAQPFYTRVDAIKTKRLLSKLEQKGGELKIAVVGGGFGGVELAASVQRRIPGAEVTLLSKGPPMARTRAEGLVNQALMKLGVKIEDTTVDAIEQDVDGDGRYTIKRTGKEETREQWDAVLWTAGSRPSDPVCNGVDGLKLSDSGRLAIDSTLRCLSVDGGARAMIWSIGDCSEIVDVKDQPAVPKTAQAAMQQSDVVASNLISQLVGGSNQKEKEFVFQDLGSMLMLGGPNAAVLAPKEGSMLAPLFGPVLDTLEFTLGAADDLIAELPVVKELSGTAGLSLGSHGLGVDSGVAPGTLAGTITGAARRAVYAARMPTNQQRAVSVISAALSTAVALAKEASDRK